MNFTIYEYKEMVKLIQKKGYDICNYYNYLESEKFVIMRHDVDFDLRKAAKMAKIEQELGIKSVYFVLICSDFYNVLSAYNLNCIKQIIDCGHEIGLHFDEVKYQGMDMQQIKEMIYEEVRVLESVIGRKVNAVSLHRPSKLMLETELELDHLVNTYGKIFFNDIKYLSDARMNWREDVFEALENGSFNKIQLLTHPFWYTETELTITDKLRDFVLRASEERYKELSSNLRDLESVLPREGGLYGD